MFGVQRQVYNDTEKVHLYLKQNVYILPVIKYTDLYSFMCVEFFKQFSFSKIYEVKEFKNFQKCKKIATFIQPQSTKPHHCLLIAPCLENIT